MNAMHVVVAVKGLELGKHRLAGVLTDAERRQLIALMLGDVLDTLHAASGVDAVSVLTADRSLLPEGVGHIDDQGFGLNAAVAHAARLLSAAGVRSMLVLPVDLPFVTSVDIAALLTAAKSHNAVIAPDARRSGTNALLLSPPDLIQPRFGAQSFSSHLEAIRSRAEMRLSVTEQAVIEACVVDRPGLAHDIDLPDDLFALLNTPSGRYGFLDAALRKAS